jgi:ABC-type glycerol-3-phosphate transport system permease component
VLLTRVLPPIAFAIPLYTMMNKMNLMGTMIPIIASHVLLSIPFIIWFLISFFAGIPVDLEESAKVDGAGEFVTFYKIILPLIAPGVAAVTILSFMTSWNEYMYAVIFVQSPKRFTIPLILATMNSEQEVAQWGLIAAGGIMSLIPILIFVLFAQNYLISGLSNGAVKG